MNNQIIVGPLLGYEDGGYYTVCVLTPPQTSAPQLRISSKAKPITFERVALSGENEFWRAEFKVAVKAKGVQVSYGIKNKSGVLSDQQTRTEWQFYVPGTGERPKIAYASCNGFSSAKLARDTNEPYTLWQRMAEQQKKFMAQPTPDVPPFSLLLMGGDQVYADEIWESKRCPSLKPWSDLNWDEQHKAHVTPTMAKEIEQFYDWLYSDRWRDKDMSLVFATIPSVMMWDDHDIFDGWGSYPDERQGCDVFKEVFKQASRCFDIFQLRCSPRNRLSAQKAHRTLRLRFGDYHILALDNRSERTMTSIMSGENWADVKALLNDWSSRTIKNLLVMTGVPVVYRSFATVEAIMDKTFWHEELEDDVHDHWSSRPHLAERMRLVMILLNFLESLNQKGCKALLLSGDVHVGALGQIWNERKEIGITQIISSGIVHPPPTAFAWAGIQLMTSDTPEALGDGEVMAEMLTPFGSSRYLRTRNFTTLQEGSDEKIWVNWVCENKDLKPNFAVSVVS